MKYANRIRHRWKQAVLVLFVWLVKYKLKLYTP